MEVVAIVEGQKVVIVVQLAHDSWLRVSAVIMAAVD